MGNSAPAQAEYPSVEWYRSRGMEAQARWHENHVMERSEKTGLWKGVINHGTMYFGDEPYLYDCGDGFWALSPYHDHALCEHCGRALGDFEAHRRECPGGP